MMNPYQLAPHLHYPTTTHHHPSLPPKPILPVSSPPSSFAQSYIQQQQAKLFAAPPLAQTQTPTAADHRRSSITTTHSSSSSSSHKSSSESEEWSGGGATGSRRSSAGTDWTTRSSSANVSLDGHHHPSFAAAGGKGEGETTVVFAPPQHYQQQQQKRSKLHPSAPEFIFNPSSSTPTPAPTPVAPPPPPPPADISHHHHHHPATTPDLVEMVKRNASLNLNLYGSTPSVSFDSSSFVGLGGATVREGPNAARKVPGGGGMGLYDFGDEVRRWYCSQQQQQRRSHSLPHVQGGGGDPILSRPSTTTLPLHLVPNLSIPPDLEPTLYLRARSQFLVSSLPGSTASSIARHLDGSGDPQLRRLERHFDDAFALPSPSSQDQQQQQQHPLSLLYGIPDVIAERLMVDSDRSGVPEAVVRLVLLRAQVRGLGLPVMGNAGVVEGPMGP
ncbi:hypothetical protein T439DRAFT_355810, partial [Meredithblackwellia eburnea MCA 4105]